MVRTKDIFKDKVFEIFGTTKNRELVKKLGVSSKTVSRFINNLPVKEESANKAVKAMGLTINEIFEPV